MQRKKELPSEPRFSYVNKKAYDMLFELGLDSFPISAHQILDALSDFIVCLPWSKAKNILNTSDPFHLRETGADARTIKRRDCDMYLIVYDDLSSTPERINWTILHEIGHILLGHLDDFDVTALDRGGLTKKAYGVLEVETNWFVSEFLMPTPIIRSIGQMTVDEISILFGVSEEAAKKKYKRVYEKGYVYTVYDELLLRQFYRFLTSDLLETVYQQIHSFFGLPEKSRYAKICRKCSSCKSYITDEEATHCFHCGKVIEESYTIHFPFSSAARTAVKEKGYAHPYIPYKTLHEHTPNATVQILFCPNCLNNEIDEDSKFCSICGFPIHNECPEEHTRLPFNTSFCPSCGTPAMIVGTYAVMEKRLNQIQEWNCTESEDWLEYDRWKYARMRIVSLASVKETPLVPALYYTRAFLDDNDNVVIVTDTECAAEEIKQNSDIILDTICRYDVIKPNEIMVDVIETI